MKRTAKSTKLSSIETFVSLTMQSNTRNLRRERPPFIRFALLGSTCRRYTHALGNVDDPMAPVAPHPTFPTPRLDPALLLVALAAPKHAALGHQRHTIRHRTVARFGAHRRRRSHLVAGCDPRVGT